jgi:hypothetical protein
METVVDGITRFKKLFNCSPYNMDSFEEVTEQEYEYFINDIIRIYTCMSHCGGVNIKNRQGKIVAYRNNKYYVLKEYI